MQESNALHTNGQISEWRRGIHKSRRSILPRKKVGADMHMASRHFSSTRVQSSSRVSSRTSFIRKRNKPNIFSDNEGNAITEAALILPILLGVIMAIFQFGMVFKNQLVLANAVPLGAVAVQQAVALSNATLSGVDPCQVATQTVAAQVPTLNVAKITYKIAVNGTSQGTHTGTFSCGSQTFKPGVSATISVNATYPCNLNLFGFAVQPSCKVGATSKMQIQY